MQKNAQYRQTMTRQGLLELKDPAKRNHPTLRWGQAVVIKFFGNSKMPSGAVYPTNFLDSLFFANDEWTEAAINQLIIDYQL